MLIRYPHRLGVVVQAWKRLVLIWDICIPPQVFFCIHRLLLCIYVSLDMSDCAAYISSTNQHGRNRMEYIISTYNVLLHAEYSIMTATCTPDSGSQLQSRQIPTFSCPSRTHAYHPRRVVHSSIANTRLFAAAKSAVCSYIS